MKPQDKVAERVRILFYSHTGLVSGAEHVLLNTILGLDRTQFEPVAVCPLDGDLHLKLEQALIPVRPINALQARFTSRAAALLGYLRSCCRVISSFRQILHHLSPDCIHANSVRAGIVATIASMGTRITVIWHIHDDLPKHPISTLIRLVAFFSRRSVFFAVSASTARIFCGRLPFHHRARVLYNAIDLARFQQREDADLSFRASLDLKPSDFLLCAVGMINPRKDLLGLLKAFKIVHDRQPAAHLAIVGRPIFNRDDLYLDQVRDLARTLELESAVHFTGPRADIPSVLRGSDLLVLNAKVEPFGLVLVEAMASGTPVLATRVGGIPEIVTDNETGFLVNPDDPQALASRLLEVIADPAGLRQAASKASASIYPRFSMERYNAEYQAGLQFHLDQRQPARPSPGRKVLSPTNDATLQVALFHDNFAQSGGAEAVAEELHRTLIASYPDTHLLSTLTANERLSPYLSDVAIRNTWMQRLPAKARLFRAYFLLYPFAVDRVDMSGYDLIVSSCFGYAKGLRRKPGSLHICYCHTPMRWVWRAEDYLSREKHSRFKKLALSLPIRWLKQWELHAASRPDLYIANSSVVADRLFRAFGIHAAVVPPPIDTSRFAPKPGSPQPTAGGFYLILSRLVPYKRLDLAIEACTRTQRKLIIIGAGPDRKRLERLAGPTVTFLGRVPIETVVDHAQRCTALLFPGEEDFGLTPLEVNAAGRPVVAFRGGGATETIREGLNGVFFDRPSIESMASAISKLEVTQWDAAAIERHAQLYDKAVFAERIHQFIDRALTQQKARSEPIAIPVTA